MSDYAREPGERDYDRINILVEDDLAHWSAQLGVTREQLAQAIQDVGPRIYDLRKVLGIPVR
jgi:hypothetical protein